MTKLLKISINFFKMKRFSMQNDFFKKQNGCHICLYVNSNTGYIHMSGDKAFEMHPNPMEFFFNFKNLKYYQIRT